MRGYIAEIGIAWGLMHIPAMMHYPVMDGIKESDCLFVVALVCSFDKSGAAVNVYLFFV